MELSPLTFARNLFAPPGALPVRRPPSKRWARGGTEGPRRVAVADVVRETPGTVTFVLADETLRYGAGQHLTVLVEIDGQTHRRCYSFSTSPDRQARPAITVKRVEGGLVSNWLHDHVRSGDELRVLPATGTFFTTTDAAEGRHCVLVAGGVGITPLASMAGHVLATEPRSRVTLLYGSRSESEILFRERFDLLRETFPGRFDVSLAVDDASAGWDGTTGPLDPAEVARLARGDERQHWFVCGPGPMMDAVAAALAGAGVPAGRIHTERFEYAAPTAAPPRAAAPVTFARSGRTVTAPAGSTLLEAGESAGVAMPSSCRMGGCGACKVQVRGRVVAAEPNCLSAAERAAGYALACCSYADGPVELPDF